MNANSRSDSDDSLFGSSSSAQPEKKRRKLNEDNQDNDAESAASKPKAASSSTVDPVLLEHAKSRLSKFAARLFDPNRIKVRTHKVESLFVFLGRIVFLHMIEFAPKP